MFTVTLEILTIDQIYLIVTKIPEISNKISTVKFTGEIICNEISDIYFALLNNLKFSHYQILSDVVFDKPNEEIGYDFRELLKEGTRVIPKLSFVVEELSES